MIGGWCNTKSVIRRSKQGNPLTTSNTQSILDPKTFTTFIIDWDGSTLQVIKDGCQNPFLVYTDDAPLTVNFIGFSTGFGSEGDFVFKNLVRCSSNPDPKTSEVSFSAGSPTPADEQTGKRTLPGRNVLPWSSNSKLPLRIQGGWRSHGFSQRTGIGMKYKKPWQSTDKDTDGRSSTGVMTYPCPKDAGGLKSVKSLKV